MPKYMVELWLDGYDTVEEMEKACNEFIAEQLDGGASCSLKIYNMCEVCKKRQADNFVCENQCELV